VFCLCLMSILVIVTRITGPSKRVINDLSKLQKKKVLTRKCPIPQRLVRLTSKQKIDELIREHQRRESEDCRYSLSLISFSIMLYCGM
jgi:hypothetical protein